MKFQICCLFIFSFLTIQLHAQFSLGATGGLNISHTQPTNLPDDVVINTESIEYAYFGIIPHYQLNEKFSVSANIEYSQKGRKELFRDINNEENTLKFRIDYLDVIPKLEYHPIPAISVGLGMYVGFNLQQRVKGKEGDWLDPTLDLFKRYDVGLAGSIRANFKNLFVSVGYNYGLADIGEAIYTDVNGEEILAAKEVNRNLQLGVGYLYSFGKE